MEQKKIYLSWQPAEHGNRYVVAELVQKSDGECCFRYIHDKDLDFLRLFLLRDALRGASLSEAARGKLRGSQASYEGRAR